MRDSIVHIYVARLHNSGPHDHTKLNDTTDKLGW